MKQEKTKKSKLWLWIVIGLAVALIAVAGIVALVIGIMGGSNEGGPAGGRPSLYWNVDRVAYTAQSELGLSTREAGEDGVFRIRFAYNGELVELPIVDKQLVNIIDTMDVMGLVKDADGVVVDAVAPEDIATPLALNAYVQQVKEGVIIANSSIAMNGMQYKIELTELTQIYDVSPEAEVPGQIIEATDLLPMDSVWIYANDLEEVTHIYMTEQPQESAVYWRAYQMWNSTDKTTSRVPDENGVYSIDFCSDGKIVTLKCKDKAIVTSIDNKSPHSCHFGFTFDEEGYITGIMNSGVGIRGTVAAERMEVLELDGSYFSGTQLIPGDAGLSYAVTLPEDCVIYDASSAAAREGRQGQQVDSLQLGDRVCVWTDPIGEPVLVYIANRMVDVPAYFNLVRKYDGTKQETTRERNAQGYYEFEVVETGKTGKKIVKTKDKELATFIDAIANRIVALKVENGIIQNAYLDDDVFGWSSIYGGYVPQIQGMIVSMVSFANPDTPTNILMNVNYKVYDVTGKDVPYGTETTLRVGDLATVTRDVSYNGICIYVTRRLVGGDTLYYNLDYQFNSTTKETKRKPDAEGWYVFTLSHKGKTVQVKTKDKELANKMDQSPSGDLVLSLRVHNGIAYELYETAAAYGQTIYSGLRVSSINSDGSYTIRATNGVERTLKMASDCVIYNVSDVYDSYKGERIYSLKVGDMVVSLADYRSEVKQIYVRGRSVPYMCANKQQLYDYATNTTLRQPDADGWYWYDLSVDGEMKKFKTKNIEIASKVDSYAGPFAIRVNGDEILNVVAANFAGDVRAISANAWDVTAYSKYSVGLQYNRPGSTYDGDRITLNLHRNVKIYDISPTAKQFGGAVGLQKGDRIMAYSDGNNQVIYIYVLFHESRVKGTVGYCEHCKQEVRWYPWAGANWDGFDCHYYLAGDVKITKQTAVGYDGRDYEAVLDLNGKKLTVTGARGFLAYKGDDISFIDSVGGGVIYATGIEGGNGGTVLISGDSTVNLYSGTLSFTDSDLEVFKGAVVYIGGKDATFNMYGGTVKGGIVNSKKTHAQGGNIFAEAGTFNLYNGVVEGGQALRNETVNDLAAQGGNIYAYKKAVINMYGGTIRNGYSNQNGGNVFLSTATLNLEGGSITGGTCITRGGNLYNQFAGEVNMIGGTIDNGSAGKSGNNVFQSHDTGVLNLAGGTITGDVVVDSGAAVTVSGAPKITVGKVCGLSVPSSLKLTIGKLTKGAEIYVNATGVFSEKCEDANAYLKAGYIKPAAPKTSIIVKDSALATQGEITWCDHCSQDVEWKEWPGKNQPASGHYFLFSDVLQTSQFSIDDGTDVVIDLYGNKFSSKNIRNFLVRGNLSIMDTVGGGIMEATGGAAYDGSIALIGKATGQTTIPTFNLYSGTLKLADEHPTFKNGGVLACASGAVNIYGGTIEGGYVSNNGGCIVISGNAAELNMYGGLITGGTAGVGGGCVNSIGKLNIQGGTIEGSIYAESSSQGTILSGATKIQELIVGSGIKVDISDLSSGAEIGITADGIFTTNLTKPQDYLTYLTSVDPYKDIKVTGSALQATLGQTYMDKVNGIHTKAEKMTADDVFAAGGDVTAVCPVCEQEVLWHDFNALAGTKITVNGHYYLSEELNVSALYNFSADACLHLNGKNITSSTRAIHVPTGYHLNIMGEGNVTGAATTNNTYGWWGVLDVPGSLDIYGGTYKCTNDGSVVTVRGVTADNIVNMYEGAELVRTDNAGIGVRLYDEGDFNMYGGKISGAGKNVVMDPGISKKLSQTLTIYGGVLETSSAVQGGNVFADSETAQVNIYGGSITGGEVYIDADTKGILISGEPKIDKLTLATGMKATLSDLSGTANIGVLANGEFTEPNADAQNYLDAGYVVSADSANSIRVENNVMIMETAKIHCPHCDKDVSWSTWPGKDSPESGHYYISGDYTAQTKQWTIADGTDVVLDLRGNAYTTTGIRNFLLRGKLSIVDTVGGGEMVVTNTAGTYGGVALLGKSGTTNPEFNLYSGTLRMADDHQVCARGGLLQVTDNTTLNMYGGAIIGGETSVIGGNVNLDTTGATFNMYGGEIKGGKSPLGADVAVKGTFNMEGGTIEGEVYVAPEAVDVSLSNGVEIGTLNVTEGKLVDVSALTTGAQIGVKGKGVFTKTLTNAESYLPYFVKLLPDDAYSVVSNAISVKTVTEADRLNAIHKEAEKMTEDDVFAAGGTVTAECPVCGEEKQWQELNTLGNNNQRITISTDGHYYLSESVDRSDYYSIKANVCLHLNGNDIRSTARAIYVSEKNTTVPYTLNIMGKGEVSGVAPAAPATAGGTIDAAGNVNLYGGTYMHGDNRPIIVGRGFPGFSIKIYDGAKILGSDTYEAPSIQSSAQDLYIYGGEISDGKGGNIDVKGSCNLYVYGGTINGGTAAKGGNIKASGGNATVTINGGTITNGDVYIDATLKSVTVSGNPVISNLDLTSGKKLVLGRLDGADITVNAADRAFTEANADASNYVGCFKAAVSGKTVKAEGNTLVITNS